MIEEEKLYKDCAIRVNHAGEYSAIKIYETQLAFTKDPEMKEILKHMLEQEKSHLEYFENLIKDQHIRPSFFLPLWNLSSKFLGMTTALMGKKYLMICTEAVEEVIDNHYEEQLNILSEEALKEKIRHFRQEELEHKEIASSSIPNLNFFESCVKNTIKYGCKIAIQLAKKI